MASEVSKENSAWVVSGPKTRDEGVKTVLAAEGVIVRSEGGASSTEMERRGEGTLAKRSGKLAGTRISPKGKLVNLKVRKSRELTFSNEERIR